MVVTDRELKPGDIFTAEYEGKEYELEVVPYGDENRLAFRFRKPNAYKPRLGKATKIPMLDRTHYGSLSAAGGAVVEPKSCNGWKFWTRSNVKTAHVQVIKRGGKSVSASRRRTAA